MRDLILQLSKSSIYSTNPSFDNGFYVAARYRYEYTRYPSSSNKDDDKVNRGDAWVGWVMG
ncbi:porin, partial [Enterobacter cloacae subsp. cloacae]